MISHSSHNARWLTIREASKYCPYGQKKLIELIKDRIIKGGQLRDNKDTWFIDRESLDEHLNGQCLKDDTREKVLDFIRSVK